MFGIMSLAAFVCEVEEADTNNSGETKKVLHFVKAWFVRILHAGANDADDDDDDDDDCDDDDDDDDADAAKTSRR